MTTLTCQQIVEKHLQVPAFCLGKAQEKWRLINKSWPDYVFEVKARCGKWWCLKVNLEGYPVTAPKGQFWSNEENRPLNHERETPNALGTRNKETDRVFLAFSSQNESIYAPFDRRRLGQYDDSTLNSRWTSEKTVTFYLENIHALLNSWDYIPAEDVKTSDTDE